MPSRSHSAALETRRRFIEFMCGLFGLGREPLAALCTHAFGEFVDGSGFVFGILAAVDLVEPSPDIPP